MRNLFGLAVCGLVAVFATVTSTEAAILTTSGDNVKVDTGSGFKPAAKVAIVRPGVVVALGATGRATIQYENGCVVALKPNQTVTVQQKAPGCKSARKVWSGRMGQSTDQNTDDPTWLILGGAVLAGGAAAIILSKDNDSASP